jgi:hypothetical protein
MLRTRDGEFTDEQYRIYCCLMSYNIDPDSIKKIMDVVVAHKQIELIMGYFMCNDLKKFNSCARELLDISNDTNVNRRRDKVSEFVCRAENVIRSNNNKCSETLLREVKLTEKEDML